MIDVIFDDREIQEALRNLQQSINNPRPALRAIGEKLTESTKRRFATTTGPDGERWPANTQVTYENFLEHKTGNYDESGKRTGNKKGYFLKDGRAGVRSARLISGKLPLTGETGILGSSIGYQLQGNFAVEIGSPMEYAAMMQFGGSVEEFPHLWGDIPERPFLGVSEDDKAEIVNILRDSLSL